MNKKSCAIMMLLGCILLLFALAPSDTVAAKAIDGQYNGHYYKLYQSHRTWSNASSYCKKMGGHLVTITSAGEESFVEGLVSQGTLNFYWLGGYKGATGWKWVTGESFSYSHWCVGQPDNFKNVESKLMMYRVSNPLARNTYLGGWNDLNGDGTCNNEAFFGTANGGFICEWDGIPIEDCDIALSKTKFTYSGKEQKPAIVVKYKDHVLTENEEYTVSFSDCVNAGTVTVTITGKELYCGSVKKEYVINPLPISKCEVTLPDGDKYIWEGKAVEPAVVVTYNGNIIPFEPDRFFKLDYANNNEVGIAKVTVSGVKNLKGKKELSFELVPKFVWPVDSSYAVSCLYYYKDGTAHSTSYGKEKSMDIGGGGNIVAIADGKVIKVARLKKSYGNYVIIEHSDGNTSLYAHMSTLYVSLNQEVKQGEIIGVMGKSGNADGVHLHFEYSGGDLMLNYYANVYKREISFEKNVRSNNAKYNADKSIVNLIDSQFNKLSGGYYHYSGK